MHINDLLFCLSGLTSLKSHQSVCSEIVQIQPWAAHRIHIIKKVEEVSWGCKTLIMTLDDQN